MEQLVSLGIGTALFATAIGIVIGVAYLVKYVKTKIGEAKFYQIVGYAELAVRAAEQVGLRLNYTGEEKKAFVLGLVRKYAEQLGIVYDEQLLDDLIEAAVQKLNEGLGKLFTEE
ncbi:MAG: phage holin, LLH family [bacterium]